jgi:CRP/FNR family cyclic AMP-dependent transcriptional regulator
MKLEDQLFNKFGQFFPRGATLFEEGQACMGMFIIQKGRVRLFKRVRGREITIDILGPDDFFGEMACLIDQPRSINAVVEEESFILVVQPDMLDDLFHHNAAMSLKIIGHLASRLKKAYGIIEQLIEGKAPSAEKESSNL